MPELAPVASAFCPARILRISQLGNRTGPAGLVRGADAAAIVAMEVFVEQQVVAEVRIALQLRVVAEDCPPTLLVAQEQPTQSTRQLLRHLFNGDEVAGTAWAFDLEVVAVVVMELLQRFDQEIIDREPDRTAPVGVAAEQATIGLGWLITHGELVAIAREAVRVILVTLGERPNAIGGENCGFIKPGPHKPFISVP